MEEDNCEENIIQKKKKQKKKTSQHENEIGTTKVKKEKCKKVKTVAKEEEGLNENGEQEEKRKIKKKRKVDSNFVKEIIDEEETNVRKKKKKTRLANNDDNQLENIQIVVKEEKVEKRKKLKDTQNKLEIKTEEEQIQNDKIPKKGKKIKTDALTGNTEPTGHVKKKKKDRPLITDDAFATKTKRKIKVEENGIKSGEPEVEKGKLKKKKKMKEELNDGLEETKKSKKKRETKDVKILQKYKNDDEKETFPEKGKPKEKKKRIKVEPATVYVEDVNEEEMEPKKKRKKAKADEKSRKNDVTMTADARIKKGKKNKTVLEVKQIDPAAKKIKKERKDSFSEENDFQNVSTVDVVFLSKTNGNTDEININRERRKALQMEIDVASQPKKTTKPTGLGQWSTAQFDSSNQQQKFLRLMGGFKKGFQPAVETSGGGGMALGKDAQQRLQQGLMGEFERAHSRRMDFSNKGAGLGFTAPSNKKFFIDANASRSVRFDD